MGRRICDEFCKYENCPYRDVDFPRFRDYTEEHCALDLKAECNRVATDELRQVLKDLQDATYLTPAIQSIRYNIQKIICIADLEC